MNTRPAEIRFWEKVDTSGTCWVWTGGQNGRGYGNFWDERRQVLAQRWIYESVHGPIPGDLTIDHLCETKLCVLVEHMQLVTREDNQRLRWVRWAERRAAA